VWTRCKCLVDCSEGKLILSDELPTILQVTLQHCGELNWAFPNIVGNLGVILHCGDLSRPSTSLDLSDMAWDYPVRELRSNWFQNGIVIDSSLTSFEMVSKPYVNYTWCERDANVLFTALKASWSWAMSCQQYCKLLYSIVGNWTEHFPTLWGTWVLSFIVGTCSTRQTIDKSRLVQYGLWLPS
jgi:hypothetical protein